MFERSSAVALGSRAAADTLQYASLWRGFARLHKLPGVAAAGAPLGDCNDQTDEEIILRDEASDQALEAASGATGGYPTLAYGTYCFTCPSSAAKLLTRDEAQRIATAPNDPPLGQIIRRHFDLNTIAGHNLNAMVQEPARDDPSNH
jgi:hypothetical protein